jgi:hypothetical protein
VFVLIGHFLTLSACNITIACVLSNGRVDIGEKKRKTRPGEGIYEKKQQQEAAAVSSDRKKCPFGGPLGSYTSILLPF